MKRSHDLTGLMKFTTAPAWQDHLRDALGDHLGPAMEEFEFEPEELADIIGDHWASVLWGCAFEDLATRTVEADGRNLADDYLKRRGWNVAGPTKQYIRALRTSVMSLYEVSNIEPGTGFLARDLIRGGDPVRISERSASQTLRAWDRIGARVVTVAGKQLLSGGVLSFTTEAADALLAGLRHAEGKRSTRAKLSIGDERLRELAPLISTTWLFESTCRPCKTATARRLCSTACASRSRVARPRRLSASSSTPSPRCSGRTRISGTGWDPGRLRSAGPRAGPSGA